MKNTPKQQIEELATLDVTALQKRHAAFFGKETTCAHRQFLFRKLVWHVQARAEGGLPALIDTIEQRIAGNIDDDSLYLLVDQGLKRLAGNLDRWPTSVPADFE